MTHRINFTVAFAAATVLSATVASGAAHARTVTFFSPDQVATSVASGVTSDTISSGGYEFAYTRDKLFTGGLGGGPIGRNVRVPWPTGVEAQAVTTPPPGVTDYKARITLSRVDGAIFDVTTFSAKLLANTAGAGGAIEVMPLVDGEDAFNDPLYFNASGYYGNVFTYTEAGGYLGSTAALKGYDTYKFNLYVDFALTALTLVDAGVAVPGDFDADYDVDGNDLLVWQQQDVATPAALDDLAAWRAGFGAYAHAATAPAAAAVPEPATAWAVAAGCAAVAGARRRERFGTLVGV